MNTNVLLLSENPIVLHYQYIYSSLKKAFPTSARFTTDQHSPAFPSGLCGNFVPPGSSGQVNPICHKTSRRTQFISHAHHACNTGACFPVLDCRLHGLQGMPMSFAITPSTYSMIIWCLLGSYGKQLSEQLQAPLINDYPQHFHVITKSCYALKLSRNIELCRETNTCHCCSVYNRFIHCLSSQSYCEVSRVGIAVLCVLTFCFLLEQS